MGAALDDASVIQYHDGVGVAHGGKAVRDDKDGASGHQRVHAALDNCLSAGVDRAGCLVHDHNRRVCYRGARDGKQLALALAEVGTVAEQHGVVALRQAADEVICTGQFGGGDALLIAGIQVAVTDILHNGAGKEVGVLQHDTQAAAKVRLLDLVDIDAVIADLAVVDIVEAVDQVGDGRLAGAGGADKGQLLARFRIQGDVVQDGLFRGVAEVDVIETHVALELGVGQGAVVVRMFPGPDVGALLALGQGAVRIFLGVDQGDIAVVGLRLLVQQSKDAVRTGRTHDDHVDLVGHLADCTGKLTGHVQERNDDADAEGHAGNADVGHIGQQQRAADQCDNDIHDVADVAQQRHQDVGKAVAVAGVEEDLVIYFVKICSGFVLVAEDLDDLLSGHHLLHEGFGFGQRNLLAQEVFGGVAGDIAGSKGHADDAGNDDQAQDHAVVHHDAEDGQQGDAGDQHLRQALADHLAQGVDVIGVIAHDVAVTVGIKVTDRQILHVVKHLFTQLL